MCHHIVTLPMECPYWYTQKCLAWSETVAVCQIQGSPIYDCFSVCYGILLKSVGHMYSSPQIEKYVVLWHFGAKIHPGCMLKSVIN